MSSRVLLVATRTRMRPEERRDHLLDLGARLFAERPYEEVHIDQIAEQAGVSRGLVYYYFPDKRAFALALLERASNSLDQETQPDPELPPLAQLERGLDLYLAWSRRHQHLSRAIHRGAASADPKVLAVIEASTSSRVGAIISGIVGDEPPHPLLLLATRSWFAYVRAACQDWLDQPDISQEDLRNLLAGTLIGAILALPKAALPTEARALIT